MQKELHLRLRPAEAADEQFISSLIAEQTSTDPSTVTGFYRIKQSIDARNKTQVWINLSVRAYINEPYIERSVERIHFQQVHQASKKVIIVGTGPAGLFAALQLIENGIKPILLERGKDIRSRRRDLAILNKEGIINAESNYCFGEGGAGTYSDGKLYTRSSKRGNINRILQLLHQFGADEKILYEAHPHIGTNKLPQIITSIREQILECGGEFYFEKKVVDLVIDKETLTAVITADGTSIPGDALILATGHSARDIFILLSQKKLQIEAKPFALGVRVEHPQTLIDQIQYHCPVRDHALPPASYGLVEQVQERGVFSFCMCPGGIIAPAATSPGELVVNGWSPSKRNNPFANSGMVVQTELADAFNYLNQQQKKLGLPVYEEKDPLLLMYFQQSVEQIAFQVGGGQFQAPAQRMTDFCNNKLSADLPDCSYLPGVIPNSLSRVLPKFINERLQKGFLTFGKTMRGYYTNEAIVVATESRTSSPVRIPRDPDTLTHPQVNNLYPCGEGAGYAGGIISAAMDGERVASCIIQKGG